MLKALFILAFVPVVSACGQRDDGGYSAAHAEYAYCLNTGGDCERAQQRYMLAAQDRMLRQQQMSVLMQTQANTSAWARWYLGR